MVIDMLDLFDVHERIRDDVCPDLGRSIKVLHTSLNKIAKLDDVAKTFSNKLKWASLDFFISLI